MRNIKTKYNKVIPSETKESQLKRLLRRSENLSPLLSFDFAQDDGRRVMTKSENN